MNDMSSMPPPSPDDIAEGLMQEVFDRASAAGFQVFLILDAARSAEIPVCLESFSDEALCLFDGAAREDLAEVAPWIVPVTPGDDVMDWYLDTGYGQNWGIFIASRLSARKIKTGLKRSLMVEDEEGGSYFFKFYLPRSFNTYVPVLTPDQANYLLRDIEMIWAESDLDPAVLHRYEPRPSGLVAETIRLALPGDTA